MNATPVPVINKIRDRMWLLLASGVLSLFTLSCLGSTPVLADINFDSSWGEFGQGDGQLAAHKGIATDASGNIYLVDNNMRVQKFTSEGEFVTN